MTKRQESTISWIDFNPANPAFRDNPYPFFEHIRSHDPVAKNPLGMWVITRYADAMDILRNPDFGHAEFHKTGDAEKPDLEGPISSLEILASYWMISKNPPDHTRLRKSISQVFNYKTMNELHSLVQAQVNRLLKTVQKQGSMDVMHDFANALPINVISELLSIPIEMRDQLQRWSLDLVNLIDINLTDEKILYGNQALQNLDDYFRTTIRERRVHPSDDIISQIIENNQQEDLQLSDNELVANCILLFVAGHETSMNLIGNGIHALLRNPDQLIKLRNNPELISSAVEEILRYDSPVQIFGRTTRKDVVVGGKHIPANQIIQLLPGAINRDPEQFPAPDQLDITRSPNRHMAFGFGLHFCLGAPLARIEGHIAINTLLQHMPNLRLHQDGVVEWRESFAMRGLKSLQVAFD